LAAQGSDGGGRAGSGGFTYQHRVAAWAATHILIGSDMPPSRLWTGQLRRVDLETSEPVDDIRLTPVDGPTVALQCKRTIQLTQSAEGEFAKTVDQFVEHHLSDGGGDQPLVLVTTSAASKPVRVDLRRVLDNLRRSDVEVTIDDLPWNAAEKRAYKGIEANLDRCWQKRTGVEPTHTKRRELLRRCHVVVLDVEPGGADEASVRDRLGDLLVDPAMTGAAWDVLVEFCAQLTIDRSGADRRELQRHMASRGIALESAR
jgi:hypothetical protein